MNKTEVLAAIRDVGLVPVLRATSIDQALALAAAIADGGVHILEVTLTIPGALDVIRHLARERPAILLGAGTVLDPETARTCILEGAQFIVSPALNLATVALCQRHGIAVIPGALTPTEIVTAWQGGADIIKVFPASALGGPSYLRSLQGPLCHIPLMPTGGVSLATATAFLEAGAVALGVGTDLVDPAAITASQPGRISATARSYLELIAAFRRRSAPTA